MIDNPYACSAVPTVTDCKCCAHIARLTGVVDFSRCGADVNAGRKVDPYMGLPVYYYHCLSCGFVFTRAFDHWSKADFARHVYNSDYARHDPAYLESRPKSNSDLICFNFGMHKASTRMLDYGSGQGLLETCLRSEGFAHVSSYDPFSSPRRPTGRFNMITCFEVFEHTTDPPGLVADLATLLDDSGAVFFSTQLCSAELIEQGIANWWYCAPRNGHISFYSDASLGLLAAGQDLTYCSFGDGRHVFHKPQIANWLEPMLSAKA